MESADLTDKPMTPEQARQVLEDEQKRKLEVCQMAIQPLLVEINEIAKKAGVAFVAQPVITPDGRISAQMVLVNAG